MTCGCFIRQLAGELTCSFHFDVFQQLLFIFPREHAVSSAVCSAG